MLHQTVRSVVHSRQTDASKSMTDLVIPVIDAEAGGNGGCGESKNEYDRYDQKRSCEMLDNKAFSSSMTGFTFFGQKAPFSQEIRGVPGYRS